MSDDSPGNMAISSAKPTGVSAAGPGCLPGAPGGDWRPALGEGMPRGTRGAPSRPPATPPTIEAGPGEVWWSLVTSNGVWEAAGEPVSAKV